MPIQKRTVTGAGKPAEPKVNPLKANPLTAYTMAKKNKKPSGFTATTLTIRKTGGGID